MEKFHNFEKIDKCCSNPPESISERQSFWDKDFQVAECGNIYEFDMMLGHEIALEIKRHGMRARNSF